MTTLALAAVGGTGREAGLGNMSVQVQRACRSCRLGTYVALAADHLLAVVLGGQGLQGRLNQTTTETEDQVEGRLLYNSSAFHSRDELHHRCIPANPFQIPSFVSFIVPERGIVCPLTFWML